MLGGEQPSRLAGRSCSPPSATDPKTPFLEHDRAQSCMGLLLSAAWRRRYRSARAALVRAAYGAATRKEPSPRPAGLACPSQEGQPPAAGISYPRWDGVKHGHCSHGVGSNSWVRSSRAHPSTGFLAGRPAALWRLSPPRPAAVGTVQMKHLLPARTLWTEPLAEAEARAGSDGFTPR